MIIKDPILTSFIDDDLYKATMSQVIFHNFPHAQVEYKFFNRGKTQFPDGFGDALREQIKHVGTLKLTVQERDYFLSLPYMRKTFVDWLFGFSLDPDSVTVVQTGGDLDITIRGYWYEEIFWEVKLMAIISELYFKLTGQVPEFGWEYKISEKAKQLSGAGCKWNDFGTRRRFDKRVQDEVVRAMANKEGFCGTSNPYFAMKYGVPVTGTSAHEAVMGVSGLYGARMANKMWLKYWYEFYQGQLGIALTDTFTTDVFLRTFGGIEARIFDGVRHDSSDPYEWGHKMINHYKKLGIDSRFKKLVFSDNLNPEKYISIHNTFKDVAIPIAGIGTNFTNDVGVKALNMVIKLTRINFGHGWQNVVKLSDEPGKHTGTPEAILHVKLDVRKWGGIGRKI